MKTLKDFNGTEIKVGDTVKVRYAAIATGAHHRSTLTGIIEKLSLTFVPDFGNVSVLITGCSNKSLKHHINTRMTVYSSHVIHN